MAQRWIPRFWESRMSAVGVAITTAAGCTLLMAIAADLAGTGLNMYATALLFLIMPAFFILGLVLIPLGLILKRRSDLKKGVETPSDGPVRKALRQPAVRRTILVIGVLTFINLILVGGAGAKAVHFMETPEFCGTMCHSVMEPEYVAYQRSPHSRVACVECHIGPGASWAVKSKLDGLRQVWHTMLGDYDRPIHAPVHALRPARDTCEKCHWPDRFHGNKLFARYHYREDETNTIEVNALALRVGGANALTGTHEGIHWHVSPDTVVEYEALDDKREKIGKITVRRGTEIVAEYLPADEEVRAAPVREVRAMDCVDCHNRPTHQYDGSPSRAVDIGFQLGLIDPKTPYLKKVALPLLAKIDRVRDTAEATFEADLRTAYERDHKDVKLEPGALKAAGRGLAELYRRNIWPRMKIGWDTYPSHIGHAGSEADIRGCFRCHDEKHATKDGKVLSQDCELCHQLLAQEEAPAELDEGLKAMLFGGSK